MKITVVLW